MYSTMYLHVFFFFSFLFFLLVFMMMMVGLVGSAVVDARLILPGELLQQ